MDIQISLDIRIILDIWIILDYSQIIHGLSIQNNLSIDCIQNDKISICNPLSTRILYITRRMKKNLQKLAILFGTKSNAYLQINCPIFAYFCLFLAIFAYLQICSKSPRIYFAFHAEYPCLFLPIFRHLTCVAFRLCQPERSWRPSFHYFLHIL